MNQTRKNIVTQAYKKMDANKDGVLTVQDIKGVYNAK
jgi:hypothetical protein